MARVYLNQIATAVPEHDIHQKFVDYASQRLEGRDKKLFKRMANRSGIQHRYSFFPPGTAPDTLDDEKFYQPRNFPDTAARMQQYKRNIFSLARQACDRLDLNTHKITHVIVTSCTGFYAPGLDFDLVQYYRLGSSVERSLIGFMGCSAAINGLKLACHIVRSKPDATVLMVSAELCTLHLQDSNDIEKLLSFLLFADGAAACILSAKPGGIAIEDFHTSIVPGSHAQLTWDIGTSGFDMVLSGQVPTSVTAHLPELLPAILKNADVRTIQHWAVHPGGRSILDAVQNALHLLPQQLVPSRSVLRDFGNMSSATILFVLKKIMDQNRSGRGCALAFGPGITAESMTFDA